VGGKEKPTQLETGPRGGGVKKELRRNGLPTGQGGSFCFTWCVLGEQEKKKQGKKSHPGGGDELPMGIWKRKKKATKHIIKGEKGTGQREDFWNHQKTSD